MKLFKQLYIIGVGIYTMAGLLVFLAGYNVYLRFDINGNRKPKVKEPVKQEIVEVKKPEKVYTPVKVYKSSSEPLKPTKIIKDTVRVVDTTNTVD
jgi:hypothetical protein